jgi:hypothetical protein
VVLAAGEALPGAAAPAAAEGNAFGEEDRRMLTAMYDAIQKAAAA